MKLLFIPDIIDNVQLEPVEIEDIDFSACQCGCDGVNGEVTIICKDGLKINDSITGIWEIQYLIEKTYKVRPELFKGIIGE